jgi:hypothetical protein
VAPLIIRISVTLWRYAWASPSTALGLLTVGLTLVTRGRCALVDGVIEAHGGFATWFLRRIVPLENGASAMTIGHVVIGRDQHALDRTRLHERVHVRQYERWGPFFIPAYFIESALAYLRGANAYYDNRFEIEAYRVSDGQEEAKAETPSLCK